jgi:class 3 adenylate cyclase
MKEDPNSAVPGKNRRLAAIMFTDIVGFSRQMGSNEARTLRLLEAHNQIIQRAAAEHYGTVKKSHESDYPRPQAGAFRPIHGYATAISG